MQEFFEPTGVTLTPMEAQIALGVFVRRICCACRLTMTVPNLWTCVKCPCGQILDLTRVVSQQDVVS